MTNYIPETNTYLALTVQDVLNLLKKGIQSNIHINPYDRPIALEDMQRLVEPMKQALESEDFRYSGTLSFSLTGSIFLSAATAQLLAELVGMDTRGKFKPIHIHMNENKIGPTCAKHFARVLTLDKHCLGVLSLGQNDIGDEGAQYFANALIAGKCQQNLELRLHENEISPEGARAFAAALESGQCPDGLRLYLAGNYIGTDGALHFAHILKHKKYPKNFLLDIEKNHIGEAGVAALADAIFVAGAREGLQIRLSDNIHDNELEKFKSMLMGKVEAVSTAAFSTQDAERCRLLLNQAFKAYHAYSILFPKEGKTLVTCSVRFIEKATDMHFPCGIAVRAVLLNPAMQYLQSLALKFPHIEDKNTLYKEQAKRANKILGLLNAQHVDSSEKLDAMQQLLDNLYITCSFLPANLSAETLSRLALMMHDFSMAYGQLAHHYNVLEQYEMRDRNVALQNDCTQQALMLEPKVDEVIIRQYKMPLVRFSAEHTVKSSAISIDSEGAVRFHQSNL